MRPAILPAAVLLLLTACATHRIAAPARSTATPATTAVSTASTSPPPTASPTEPFAVGVRTFTFVDASRPTPATSAGQRQPSRTLVTTVWYPATGAASAADIPDAPALRTSAPFPIVVWAHGFNRVSSDYRSLLHRWASAGYVLAGPTLPSLRRPGPGQGPASEADQASEPGDLGYVVTALASMNADPSSPLRGVVDPTRVIAAGHSDGAIDALALALAHCCHDPRVVAVVSIAGAEEPGVFGTYSGAGGVPLLVVQGDRDVHLTVSDAHSIYDPAAPPKYLLVLHGADHNTALLDVNVQPARLLADAVVAFSHRYTKNAQTIAGLDGEAKAAGFADFVHDP